MGNSVGTYGGKYHAASIINIIISATLFKTDKDYYNIILMAISSYKNI